MPCPAPKVGGAVFASHVSFQNKMSVAVHSWLGSTKLSIKMQKLELDWGRAESPDRMQWASGVQGYDAAFK